MYAIIGLGAVGSLLALFLNRVGHRPYVLARSRVRRVVWGGETYTLDVAYVDEVPDVEYTLVAVKAYDTEGVLPHIRGVPVIFQNGIGGLELVVERYGKGLGAVVTYGAYRSGDVVEVRGAGEIILPEDAGRLVDDLRNGGANVRAVPDVGPYRWLKTIVNAAINPVTALLRAPNGVVVEDPWARAVAEAAAREGGEVASRSGVRLPGEPVEETFRVAAATRWNLSSMYQDVARGGRTEVDYINGAIVRRGRELGVPTPVNETLWRLVKALEGRRTALLP